MSEERTKSKLKNINYLCAEKIFHFDCVIFVLQFVIALWIQRNFIISMMSNDDFEDLKLESDRRRNEVKFT